MQVMTRVQSIAADTLSTNIIAGEANEFLAGPSVVKVYARSAAVGLRLIFQVGNEVFSQDQEIGATAGFPTRPQDFFVQGVGGPGERIILQLRNTTVGAIIGQILIEVVQVRR